MSRKRGNEHTPSHENDIELSHFASGEIEYTAEQDAVRKGELFLKAIAPLRIDELLDTIRTIPYAGEDIHKRRTELNVDEAALVCLDRFNPPIPYPFYFSTPAFLMEHPELILYYRNLATLSRKVMQGIGMPTDAYEDSRIPPSEQIALELARYFNGIISKLITMAGVTANLHLEMVLLNIGIAAD